MTSLRVLAHTFRAWRRNRRGAKHEPEAPFIPYLLAGSPTVLHVGASDGRHSVLLLQAVPGARVHAFEPSGFSFAVLRQVLAWHGLRDRVELNRAAVADYAGELLGELRLVTPRKTSGRMGRAFAFVAEAGAAEDLLAGGGQARPELVDRGVSVEVVPVVSIDGYCDRAGIERVDMIRMDIEGAEVLALAGAAKVLRRDRPSLLLEVHPAMIRERFNAAADDLVEQLLAAGYRMWAVEHGQLVERTPGQPLGPEPWRDYFFVHPTRAAELPPGPFRRAFARPAPERASPAAQARA